MEWILLLFFIFLILRYVENKPKRYASSTDVFDIGNFNKVQYMNSKEWFRKKQLMYKKYNHQCVLCKSTQQLVVHHLTYKRLGEEYLDDLVLLCKDCHQRQHDTYGYDYNTDYSGLV